MQGFTKICMLGLIPLLSQAAAADFSLLQLVPASTLTQQANQAMSELASQVISSNRENGKVVFDPDQVNDADFENTVRLSLRHSCETTVMQYYSGQAASDDDLHFQVNVDLHGADPIEMQKLAINPSRYEKSGYPIVVHFNAQLTGCDVKCYGRTFSYGGSKVAVNKTCESVIVPEKTGDFHIDEGAL